MKIILTPLPTETMCTRRKCPITYTTMNLQEKKVGIALEEEIEKAVNDILGEIVFYTRRKRFGAIEMKFTNEEVKAAWATMILKIKMRVQFASYLGSGFAKIEIRKVLPESGVERMAAAVLLKVKEDIIIVQATGPQ